MMDGATLKKRGQMANVFYRNVKFVLNIGRMREHQNAKSFQVKWPVKPAQNPGHP